LAAEEVDPVHGQSRRFALPKAGAQPERQGHPELAAHASFKVETDIPVYFADPHSPWQRATNENTNGLLRQYFQKGTDLSRWKADEIEAVATALNGRPRKVLGWKTPAEALDEHLRSLQQVGVASID
jgi:transposase, IS30 family